MGRPSGSRNKPKDDAAPTHGVGHNAQSSDLTDDERRALTFQHKRHYEEALATKKAADAALKNVCKKAKAECGDHAVADIKDLIVMDEPAGELALRAEVERKLRVARWSNAPMGTQFGLFDPDRTPAVDRAFEEGKKAGMEGKSCAPPHDASVPQYKQWMDGWNEGQAILQTAMAKQMKRPVVAKLAEAVQ